MTGTVRVKGLIGRYTILKRNGAFVTLVDFTGHRVTVVQFRMAGGFEQDKVSYNYGELKTHASNITFEG